jgi:2-(1,2-epoxy-1,2-dihydrophenyl)acetyl-CoA isomerase
VNVDDHRVEGLGVTLADGVLRVVLDRPERRNALDDPMVAGLVGLFGAVATDDDVRVVVLSGAGDHFCGGFDIVSRNAPSDGPRPRVGSIQRRLPGQAHRLIPLVLTVQVPVVCAVRGWAAGIGLQLALACDFAVVAEDARLWEPFAQRGFTPDSGATWLLPRRVGEVRARQMLLLGTPVSGTEAADWGMVHRAVAGAGLDDVVEQLVVELAAGPTVALGLTKRLLHAGRSGDLDSALAGEALALELSSRSEDFREGLAALRDKRAPRFTGR